MKNQNQTLIPAFLLALALSGCATQRVWVNRSLSSAEAPQQFSADRSECEARGYQSIPLTTADKAAKADWGIEARNRTRRKRITTDCMVGKGWSLEAQAPQ